MKTGLVSISLFGITIFILAGCAVTAPPGEPEVCRAECRVDINLPDEPANLHVEGGSEVNFRIQNAEQALARSDSARRVSAQRDSAQRVSVQRDSARIVLSFEQPALLDNQGTPLYTLDLRSGNNLYEVNDEGVCRPPDGCRYVIIDVGRPDRPSIISTPKIIVY
ncbi:MULTISPECIES: hypothetical protein [unclassified Wenzhouxiangella]|uniref:hypothetical protein n=1 Tax=unclassified Wenzhouxiangella TaxID=2613841 RepID=UPI0015F28D45|nr:MULTISPECIES: hypothetical protein [unclassified Wenzhouxiangella]